MRLALSWGESVATVLRGAHGCEVGLASLIATTSQSIWNCAADSVYGRSSWSDLQHQQVRFASKGGGKQRRPTPAAAPAPFDPSSPQALSLKARREAGALLSAKQPKWTSFPGVSKEERDILQNEYPTDLLGPTGKLRTARQLLPLAQYGVEDVASLLHKGLSKLDGRDVQLGMFEFGSPYQSAPVAAGLVADALECGFGWGRITQFFIKTVDMEADVAGIKIQVKGRLSGKAGKAGKKVWEHGQVSAGTFTECVDYAEQGALTRAGLIGVKVWIRYRPGSVTTSVRGRPPSTEPIPLQELLNMPRTPIAQPPTAWWNVPGPLQPAYCDAANSWKR